MCNIIKNKIGEKIPVGILGATGTVGLQFVHLLKNHPWFKIACVAASSRSAGKSYGSVLQSRGIGTVDIPTEILDLQVLHVEDDIENLRKETAVAFSALSMAKDKVRETEIAYARAGIPVVSNNSAHRWTEDVPMIIPEINPHHLAIIDAQRKNRGWEKGLIVVKPNCSIQSFVPVLKALQDFKPQTVVLTACQAVSGAGKSLENWPEMTDNVIPYIPGEDEKSEKEPLKILGDVTEGHFVLQKKPVISATCVRVPVSDGHMASVSISFQSKPDREELVQALTNYRNPIADLNLPSAPKTFIRLFKENGRPQTAMDRNLGNGMTISIGRIREDRILHWKMIALSHNTLRGAAGGGVLTAELLVKKNYIG